YRIHMIRHMTTRLRFTPLLLAAAAFLVTPLIAQTRPPAPKSVRIYIVDCGTIGALDAAFFDLKPEEIKGQATFVTLCYLIVHPRGTLLWDSGQIADEAFPPTGPATQGISTVTKELLPQLAQIGYKPADITYFALSHFHSDHTANANSFAGSTWIVQETERTAMFGYTGTSDIVPEARQNRTHPNWPATSIITPKRRRSTASPPSTAIAR
ncbi:MAG: MBL fold metallo-hydrolase, partial [Acidobacteriota bacterium]